jgi:molybdopterin-guanine dinucleotide biosynthesis protein A
MGSPKVAVRIPGGLTLGESAVRRLASVCARVVLAGESPGLPEALGRFPVVPDIRPGRGPLGGIEALLRSGLDEAYLVLPCDLPLVSESILLRLVERAAGGPAVCRVEGSGTFEPFPLVVPAMALSVLESMLGGGSLAVRRFVDGISPRFLDLPSEAGVCFRNVNEPGDLPGGTPP